MIIASKKDIAGMNIAEILEAKGVKVHYIEESQILAENLPKSEYYVFASRHKSESGETCLTVHTTGNFSDEASHGGNPKELAYCNPFMMRSALKILKEKNITNVPVVMEATHHGPTNLKSPVIFIEVGSKEKDWENKEYCGFVAETIVELINSKITENESYIYFGGSHYNEEATRLMVKNYAIGHICPKYACDFADEEIIKQMIEKTKNSSCAIIDWKLKSEEKNRIVGILDKLNFPWIKKQSIKD
ncbi:MAG: D-aminoacyl-tRNA deacylase [Candidatus Nanoarchaeia archaeon]|nr:D-aminoacyl-tRNA deacylase [Candidatus Nanoarchaeia archaeon]